MSDIIVQIVLADGTPLERTIPYEEYYNDRSHGLVMIDEYAVQMIPFTLYRHKGNVICGEEVTDYQAFSMKRINRTA
jgi:hypothetical protein